MYCPCAKNHVPYYYVYLMIRCTYVFSKLFYQRGQIMKKTAQCLWSMLFFYPLYMAAVSAVVSQPQQNSPAQDIFIMPLSFTQQHINSFFKDVLPSSRYKQEILPNNLMHLVQFVEHGMKRRQGRAYTQSIMRLFHNTLKGSMYMNAYAYQDFLTQFNPLLSTLCATEYSDPTDAMKKRVYEILYEHFLHKFDINNGSTAFFDGITTDITTCIQNQTTLYGDISRSDFRKTLMSFLEQTLGKLVWSPADGLESWNNTKKIGALLEQMLEKKVLADEDDLNDLCISLVERYALFLDINATALPLDMYAEIRKDVLAHNLMFIELEEQESFLEKKSERMMRAVLEAEAKKRALEYGIVTT